jgi:hypothetical protein
MVLGQFISFVSLFLLMIMELYYNRLTFIFDRSTLEGFQEGIQRGKQEALIDIIS